jgi:hypothetical protein
MIEWLLIGLIVSFVLLVNLTLIILLFRWLKRLEGGEDD